MKSIQHLEYTALKYIEKLILPSDTLCPMWNRENFIFRKKAKWNYIDSCMIRSLILLYENTNDSRLIDYVIKFTDTYVNENGSIPTMKSEDFNLDNINGGRNLIYLHRKTGIEKYRLAYEKIYSSQLEVQPRLYCGNYWHKDIYPYQLWLDGVYMALPFLAEYSSINSISDAHEDIINQLSNIQNIMKDEKTGLYYHGYDETRLMNWSDNETGLSSQFWLRSIGWLCAGLADLCELMPENRLCRTMLHDLVLSLEKHLLPDGMLMQLPARHDLEGNYPETSGTLLYAYSAMKSARLGINSLDSAKSGLRSLITITEKYIEFDNDMPILKNICLMGGLGGKQNRDGSAEYYLSERIVENDAKGIAPFLMAYNEFLIYRKNSDE